MTKGLKQVRVAKLKILFGLLIINEMHWNISIADGYHSLDNYQQAKNSFEQALVVGIK